MNVPPDDERLYFNKVFDDGVMNHLLTGNGLNDNFRCETSYPAIIRQLQKIDPETYGELDSGFLVDLEKAFVGKKPFEQRAMKNDILNALTILIGDSIRYKDIAANLLSKFNSVFTLNLDPLLHLILADMEASEIPVQDMNAFIRYQETLLDLFKNMGSHEFNDINKNVAGALYGNDNFQILTSKVLHHLNRRISLPARPSLKVIDSFYRNGDEYKWKENDPEQTIFYLHGSTPIYCKNKDEIIKIYPKTNSPILEAVQSAKRSGFGFLCVMAGSWRKKKKVIAGNKYLSYCFERLKNLQGDLYVYGVEFGEKTTDDHVWKAINQNKSSLQNIYISIHHGKEDGISLEEKISMAKRKAASILKRHSDKVRFLHSDLKEFTPK